MVTGILKTVAHHTKKKTSLFSNEIQSNVHTQKKLQYTLALFQTWVIKVMRRILVSYRNKTWLECKGDHTPALGKQEASQALHHWSLSRWVHNRDRGKSSARSASHTWEIHSTRFISSLKTSVGSNRAVGVSSAQGHPEDGGGER